MEASGLVSRVASLISLNVVMLCRLSTVVDVGEVLGGVEAVGGDVAEGGR